MDYRLPLVAGILGLVAVAWIGLSGSGSDAAATSPYDTLETAPWGSALWSTTDLSSAAECNSTKIVHSADFIEKARNGYTLAEVDKSANEVSALLKKSISDRLSDFTDTSAFLGAVSGKAVFVSPDGSDEWSGGLASPNDQADDGPFFTLRHAVDFARKKGRIRLIFVREGTYFVGAPLRLNRSNNELVIAAYPGETPVLSGGEIIEKLEPLGKGVMGANLGTPTGLDLIIDGVRTHVAQSPPVKSSDRRRTGWHIVREAGEEGSKKNRFQLPGGAPKPSELSDQALIQVLARKRWTDHFSAIDPELTKGRNVVLKDAARYAIKDGATVRILNDPSFLDKSGGFAWDPGGAQLLVASSALQEDSEVIVPRFGPVIDVAGAKDVAILGLTIAHVPYDQSAIQLSDATRTTIAYNTFTNVGTGVKVSESTSSSIIGNRLEHLGKTGVQFNPGSRRFYVAGNMFSSIGEVEVDGAGIWAIGLHDSVIAHNEFYNASRYGISLKDAGNTPNTNNLIEFNRLIRTNMQTSDTGAIEMLGRSAENTRTIIRQNFIYDTGGLATDKNGKWLERYQSSGIYLDDSTSGVTVNHNYMGRVGWGGVHVHGGDDVTITNNIAILDTERGKFLRLQDWRDQETGMLERISISKNIVYGTKRIGPYWDFNRGGEPRVDRNLLYNVSKYRVKAMPEYGVVAHAGDQESIVANPGFRNVKASDFRLTDASPAQQLGIEDLEWTLMGAGPFADVPNTYRCAATVGLD